MNRLEEVAVFRGSGSWIPEVAACTLSTKYIRKFFKIATFSRLSGINHILWKFDNSEYLEKINTA